MDFEEANIAMLKIFTRFPLTVKVTHSIKDNNGIRQLNLRDF